MYHVLTKITLHFKGKLKRHLITIIMGIGKTIVCKMEKVNCD